MWFYSPLTGTFPKEICYPASPSPSPLVKTQAHMEAKRKENLNVASQCLVGDSLQIFHLPVVKTNKQILLPKSQSSTIKT